MSVTFIPDLGHADGGGVALVPGAYTSSQNGSALDLKDTDDLVNALVVQGTNSGTSQTWASKYQEAIEDPANTGNPLSSDWSDVSGGAHTGLTSATTSGYKEWIHFRRTKRFLRVVTTIGGSNTPTFNVAHEVVVRKKEINPTAGNYTTITT